VVCDQTVAGHRPRQQDGFVAGIELDQALTGLADLANLNRALEEVAPEPSEMARLIEYLQATLSRSIGGPQRLSVCYETTMLVTRRQVLQRVGPLFRRSTMNTEDRMKAIH
jgi:hypothetical protein